MTDSANSIRARPLRLRGWSVVILLLVVGAFGCSPAALSFLVLPFVDDKIPAKCKLSSDKEVTLALVAWFGNLEIRPEVMPADSDLAERLSNKLRESFKYNKEKIKLVPCGQVRVAQNKLSVGGAWSPAEVGKLVKADYVVALEINNLTLYEKNSYNQLFRGVCEMSVKAYDVRKADGEQVVFEDFYRCDYPRSQPVDAGGTSVIQFRSVFLEKMARDLSKIFSAYPMDQRVDMD